MTNGLLGRVRNDHCFLRGDHIHIDDRLNPRSDIASLDAVSSDQIARWRRHGHRLRIPTCVNLS